jgi:hypothetical protein
MSSIEPNKYEEHRAVHSTSMYPDKVETVVVDTAGVGRHGGWRGARSIEPGAGPDG